MPKPEDLEPGAWSLEKSEARNLVIHGDPERPRIVVAVIVVHSQVQATAASHPNRIFVIADEKIFVRLADAANQCGRRTVRHRPCFVTGRTPLATGAILSASAPANTADRGKVNGLARPQCDAGIAP